MFTRIPAYVIAVLAYLLLFDKYIMLHEIIPFRLPTSIKLYVYEEYK